MLKKSLCLVSFLLCVVLTAPAVQAQQGCNLDGCYRSCDIQKNYCRTQHCHANTDSAQDWIACVWVCEDFYQICEDHCDWDCRPFLI